jgi:hypothetical protein
MILLTLNFFYETTSWVLEDKPPSKLNSIMCHQIEKFKIVTCNLDLQNQDKCFFQLY